MAIRLPREVADSDSSSEEFSLPLPSEASWKDCEKAGVPVPRLRLDNSCSKCWKSGTLYRCSLQSEGCGCDYELCRICFAAESQEDWEEAELRRRGSQPTVEDKGNAGESESLYKRVLENLKMSPEQQAQCPLEWQCSSADVTLETLADCLLHSTDQAHRLVTGITPLERLCCNSQVSSSLLRELLASSPAANCDPIAIQLLCLNPKVSIEVLMTLLKQLPAAVASAAFPLHWLCQSTPVPSAVLSNFVKQQPDAAQVPDKNGHFPLHSLCSNPSVTCELLSMLLNSWPDAAKKSDRNQSLPLHLLCSNPSVNGQMLLLLLQQVPDAVQHPDHKEQLPLHLLCSNSSVKSNAVTALITSWPDAATKGDCTGRLPVFALCGNRGVTGEALQALLEHSPNMSERWEVTGSAFHALCSSDGITPSSLSVLFKYYKAGATASDKKKENPLHKLCNNRVVTAELLEVYLEHCGGAAKHQDGWLQEVPLHKLCHSPCVTNVALASFLKLAPGSALIPNRQGAFPFKMLGSNLMFQSRSVTPEFVLEAAMRIQSESSPIPNDLGIKEKIQILLQASAQAGWLSICRGLIGQFQADVDKASGADPRTPRDFANGCECDEVRAYFKTVGLFCQRYLIQGKEPRYQSDTCEVWFCVDQSDDGQDQPLALKFLGSKEAWEREMFAHQQMATQTGYARSAVQLLVQESLEATEAVTKPAKASTPPDAPLDMELQKLKESLEAEAREAGLPCLPECSDTAPEASGFPFTLHGGVLVMSKADCNLRNALSDEKLAYGFNSSGPSKDLAKLARDKARVMSVAKDIAEALKTFHEAKLAHCDLKPANILRVEGRWVLGDLDAAAKIGADYAGFKVSTAFLPPEMLQITEDAEGGKVAIPRTTSIGEDGRSADPISLVLASESIDIWAYGVVLYQLCTGAELLQSNIYDNVVKAKDLLTVADADEWKQWLDEALREVDKQWTSARHLLRRLLCYEVAHRCQCMADVLSHPFFFGAQMPNDFKEKVLILAPIDKPKGLGNLYSMVEEAISIGRQLPNCEVKAFFSPSLLNSELDKGPALVFFCCHREENRIYLGRNKEKHLSNDDLLSLFKSRVDSNKPNPPCIVFSTCGGEGAHEGLVLPLALLDAKVGVKFIVFWLGPAPDEICALYSKLFVEGLAEAAELPEQSDERYQKSHWRALQKLPEAIGVSFAQSPYKDFYLDALSRLKCLPELQQVNV